MSQTRFVIRKSPRISPPKHSSPSTRKRSKSPLSGVANIETIQPQITQVQPQVQYTQPQGQIQTRRLPDSVTFVSVIQPLPPVENPKTTCGCSA